MIGEDGKQIGVIATAEGIRLARERNLDLIEIAPQAQPPVARIMNYGKYLYQTGKEERKTKAHRKEVEVKGIRLSMRISRHDMEVKAQRMQEFLEGGDKVKVDFMLRGREKSRPDFAQGKLREFLNLVTMPLKVEQELRRQPWGFTMLVGKDVSPPSKS